MLLWTVSRLSRLKTCAMTFLKIAQSLVLSIFLRIHVIQNDKHDWKSTITEEMHNYFKLM